MWPFTTSLSVGLHMCQRCFNSEYNVLEAFSYRTFHDGNTRPVIRRNLTAVKWATIHEKLDQHDGLLTAVF